MDHGSHGGALGSAANATAAASNPAVQWPLLAAIAAATFAVCLASALLPFGCLRLVARASAAEDVAADETEEARRARHAATRRRVAAVTGSLTSVGAGVILATCFIGLMPAALSAYAQLCAGATACLAAASLAPPAGCLASCLLFWLARAGIDLARRRRGGEGEGYGETKPLVLDEAAGCCSDAAPTALQDSTTAGLVTAALLLKAAVEGLALPSMLRVASPLFVALGKCLHEACCGLVVGLAWCGTGSSGGGGGVGGRWGLIALVAYAVAASGSILLGGLTASVRSPAGTAVQFALLMVAAGAGLQAAFVHILPRLPVGPASPALVLAGMLVMTLVAALHHLVGGGHG